VAAAALAALIIGLLVLRTSGVYFIMVTLAFSQMLFYAAVGSKALGGSDGASIYVRPSPDLWGWAPFNLANRVHFYYVVLGALALTYMLLHRLARSLFGHVLVGIRVNAHRMEALGYPVFRYKLAAFVLAGALAGMAGLLDAAQFGNVTPELLGWRQSAQALLMVILGGMGSLSGPMLGALVLTVLQELLGDLTRHWPLPLGLVIIVASLTLPRGLSGLWARGEAPPRG